MSDRIHGFQPFGPRWGNDCVGGRRSDIAVYGNTATTKNYVLEFKKGDFAEVHVTDRKTGEKLGSYGDPYIKTGDGDFTSFQNGNVTINLPDGSELTLVPTDKPGGKNTIAKAVYTYGDDGVVATFDAEGNPTTEARPGEGYSLDFKTRNGVNLFSKNGSIEDLFVPGGGEIEGRDTPSLDVFRTPPFAGGGRPHIGLPNWHDGRPHIGLPNWRADGPFSWWPRHASGPRHGAENCGPHNGRHESWQVRNLMDQLRSYQWLAHHGPWGTRIHARHEMHRIQDRLRELTA